MLRKNKVNSVLFCSKANFQYMPTLITKKRTVSSHIRKFRMEQLQSHIWLTASSYMVKYLCISSYISKHFLIYDFATAPLWISSYMRKIWCSFLTVYYHACWGKQSLFCSFPVPDYTIRKSTSQWFCPPLSKPFRKPLEQQAIKFRNIGCLIWSFPLRQHDF